MTSIYQLREAVTVPTWDVDANPMIRRPDMASYPVNNYVVQGLPPPLNGDLGMPNVATGYGAPNMDAMLMTKSIRAVDDVTYPRYWDVKYR